MKAMRAEMCESLMAVASERPSKALHAQELEMSLYESAPTKVGRSKIIDDNAAPGS